MKSAERRSMRFALAVHLLMALAGVVGCWLWNAQALALDGLVSGLNAVASLAAHRLSDAVSRPPSRSYPFGYGGLETLYSGSRSLLLLGILAFAAISSTARILTHLEGSPLPLPRFGPIAIYGIAMAALCLLLAWVHHHQWRRGGSRSPLLAVERRAALVDAATSGGVAFAFALTPLLRPTPLAGLIPISDAVIVLILCCLLLGAPLRTLRGALRELTGGTVADPVRREVKQAIDAELGHEDIRLVDAALFPSGRTLVGLLYLDPTCPLASPQVDLLRERLERACRRHIPEVTLELVLTTTRRWS